MEGILLKLFSALTDENKSIVGVEYKEQKLNLTTALCIYQKARGIKNPVPVTFLQVMVEMGTCSGELIDTVLNDSWVQSKWTSLALPDSTPMDVPISRPSKIICIGRNYKEHARELDHQIPDEVLYFSKAPSSLLAHEGDIRIPRDVGRVDHEAELAVIIGRETARVPETTAISHVAGYSILNDVTARALQKADIAQGKPWFRSKSLDTFCPMGPYLIPADRINETPQLDIECRVNGEIRQKANTRDMIFPIPVLIARISRFITLLPGDIIATGTPQGVSPVQSGDIIEITIEGLGTLKNRVIETG
jgi:5-oxopent-3-ene-1,2,5-tricarboxylate decarboxylase / 2-hydroxyhepta-2,4-diene-1,7-dioate isomerase